MKNKRYCAHISQERQDPFIGTAAHAELWVMLEYTGPWEWIAVYNNQLPDQVKEHFMTIANNYLTEHSIAIFIRQHTRPLHKIRCFIGITRPDREALYQFQFDRYEELLDLDLSALKAGAPTYDGYLTNQPLYLVCTNGKHDMCCAKFGMPVHKEATRIAGEHVWHCSHIGGDQFAANMVCFPHGIYYSRVTVPEVASIIEADRHGQIYAEKYRGRTCYPSTVQAADYYLRKQSGNYALDAYHWLDSNELAGCETIRFQSAADGTIHSLTIQPELCELEGAMQCSCDNTGKNTVQKFRLAVPERL